MSDAFDAAFGGDSSQTAAQPSSDAFDAAFGDLKAASSAPAAPSAQPEESYLQEAGDTLKGMAKAHWDAMQMLGHGEAQGLRDVGQAVSGVDIWLGNKLASMGLPSGPPSILMPGAGTSQAANQSLANEKAQYEQAYGSNPIATGGRILGNIAGSVPLIEAGGSGVASVGVDAANLASKIPVVSKIVPAARAVGNFLMGNAGQGNGVANALVNYASRGVAGAGQGAAANAMIGQDPTTGAEVGGALGVVAPVAADVGKLGAKIIAGATRPLTQAGQDTIVGNFLRDQAEGGNITPDLKQYVPGSPTPTLAEATGNPGIAGVQRVVSTEPSQVVKFNDVKDAQNVARNNFVDQIAGTPDTIDDLTAAREGAAIPKLKAALSNAGTADAQPVVDEIKSIVASPAGQRDVVASSLDKVASKLTSADGALQSDPAQLYGIRQSINDMISPLAAGTASDSRLATKELMQVRDKLDDAIEQTAPGYKDYLATYSQMSQPIDAAKYLQGLNLSDSQGNVTLAKVDNAIKRIGSAQGKGGANAAKNISDDQFNSLMALRDDLRRGANIRLGKAIGSDSVQNLSNQGAINLGGIPTAVGGLVAGHPLLGAGLSLLNNTVYRNANNMLMDRLGNALSDANVGMNYLQAPAPSQASQLGSDIAKVLVPYGIPATMVVGNRLMDPAR